MRQVNESGWEEPGVVTGAQRALARCAWSPQASPAARQWLLAQLFRQPPAEDDAPGDAEDWDL